MVIKQILTTRLVVACGIAALATAACKKSDEYAAGHSDSATGAIAPAAPSATPAPSSEWTDESILAYVRAEDMDEIKVNELAAKKATSPALKTFAAKMAADHRAGLKALPSKAMAADTSAEKAHDVMDKSRDELKDLTDKAAGADWDKDYLDMQIKEHQGVLDKLQDAAKNTASADVKALLVKVSGAVQEHLTKAQEIRATLK